MAAKTSTKAFYYEYYPHYMGTTTFEGDFDIEEMDQLHASYVASEKVRKPWSAKVKQPALVLEQDRAEDAFESKLENNLEGEDESGASYAWRDILTNWPKIRRALERKGEWADDWEEGSHGISMTSARDARKLVGKLEAKHTEDEFGW